MSPPDGAGGATSDGLSVNGNKLAGLGLRSTGPAGAEVSGVLDPGLIIIGGGLLHGALDPEESPTSHLEFGSLEFMGFIGLFGPRFEKGGMGEKGPFGIFGFLGVKGPFWVFGVMGDKG